MAEYLARVSWDSIERYRSEWPKVASAAGGDARLPLTDQYGSDQHALAKVGFGDGLWLFMAPVILPGKRERILPPSVLGRLEISHRSSFGGPMHPAPGAPGDTPRERPIQPLQVSGGYRTWVCGDPGSALPIHNAYHLFRSLTFEGRFPRVDPECPRCNRAVTPRSGPFGHLLQHFQSIRRLTADGAARLAGLEAQVEAQRTVFLSYRQASAGALVREVARLLSEEALCWWDTQALPQARHYGSTALKQMLDDGIRQAGWFAAFCTPDFADSKWTREEWAEALERRARSGADRRLRILPVLLPGGSLPGPAPDFPPIDVGADPGRIAAKLLQHITA